MELGITPGLKGEFDQQFHFYLDIGNVLVTKEVEFTGACVADAPAVDSRMESNGAKVTEHSNDIHKP